MADSGETVPPAATRAATPAATTAATSARPPSRRRRWLRGLGLGLVVFLLIVTGAGAWWWFRGPGPACGALSRDEIGRVTGHRPGPTAVLLSVLPQQAPSTTGPGPAHLCSRSVGEISPGLVQGVVVGLTPRQDRSADENAGLALLGAASVEVAGAKGWRWEVAAMQEVDLLTARGDRLYVRVTLRSGVPPDTAVKLAELAVRRLDRG